LQPLAALPVLAPHLQLRTTVVAISRQGMLKNDEIGTGARAQHPFRLLVDGPGGEAVHTAGLVIDASGSYTNFFVLGMKSYGRNSTFLLRVGYEQVDEVTGAYEALRAS
jgi:hypothetical protein